MAGTDSRGEPGHPLAAQPVDAGEVTMIDGIVTTRAIRRYTDEQIPDRVLRDIFFAATRAPSGSNRQPFRFLVFRHGARADEVKQLVADGARAMWDAKFTRDRYAHGSGTDSTSPKARMAAAMEHYVDSFASAPVLVLPCLNRYRPPDPAEGSNVYPACQNLLLAARAYGYGGVLTMFHREVEAELRALLDLPEATAIAATITLGRPAGGHGPVRRRPMAELVYEDEWEASAGWAVDPPATRSTAAGPPTVAT